MIASMEVANRQTAEQIARDARGNLPSHWQLRNKVAVRNRFPGSKRNVYRVVVNAAHAVFHERGSWRTRSDGSRVKHNQARRFMRKAVSKARQAHRARMAKIMGSAIQ